MIAVNCLCGNGIADLNPGRVQRRILLEVGVLSSSDMRSTISVLLEGASGEAEICGSRRFLAVVAIF